ncbi:response regulator [Henriciella marina]|uniref:response regulator n=1 Tax=Henriciella marina TaxID=453851 RepID=UPI00058DCB1F|nr:response regulator [Henriciella marina]
MQSCRILIADDDRMLRALLVHKMKKIDCEVIEASDGKQALDLLASEQVNLVILDGMMPGMDGVEALQHIRRDPATKTIPVMMLTARRGQEDAMNAIRLGATDYISKPFNPEDLLLRVKALLAPEGDTSGYRESRQA